MAKPTGHDPKTIGHQGTLEKVRSDLSLQVDCIVAIHGNSANMNRHWLCTTILLGPDAIVCKKRRGREQTKFCKRKYCKQIALKVI